MIRMPYSILVLYRPRKTCSFGCRETIAIIRWWSRRAYGSVTIRIIRMHGTWQTNRQHVAVSACFALFLAIMRKEKNESEKISYSSRVSCVCCLWLSRTARSRHRVLIVGIIITIIIIFNKLMENIQIHQLNCHQLYRVLNIRANCCVCTSHTIL